jgi:hypothetical protein
MTGRLQIWYVGSSYRFVTVHGYWLPERRCEDDFPGIVDSLDVPMSPNLVNERMWALIAHGLISTERTQSHENHPHTFCVLTQ